MFTISEQTCNVDKSNTGRYTIQKLEFLLYGSLCVSHDTHGEVRFLLITYEKILSVFFSKMRCLKYENTDVKANVYVYQTPRALDKCRKC